MSAPVSAATIEKAARAIYAEPWGDRWLSTEDGTPNALSYHYARAAITAVRADLVAEALAPVLASTRYQTDVGGDWICAACDDYMESCDRIGECPLSDARAALSVPVQAADSPRWCASCDGYGDHHTDRHPVQAAEEVGGRGE